MENSFTLVPPSLSLLTIPVEVLYRILDQLNIKDILFSFRRVCTKFHSITNSYNRLTIEISNHPSDTLIDRFYRIISPENVGALILNQSYTNAESNNIDWFFSFGDIHRFTRLRFVNLKMLYEKDYRTLLRHLATLSRFGSLKIVDRKIFKNETNILLSTVIALPSIRTLDLDISSLIIDQISWPNHSTLRELHLKKSSYNQWCHIIRHSPNLQIASVADFDMNKIDKTIPSIRYQQLNSSTLSDILFSIDQLEMLLSFCPSLVNLNLTANKISLFENLRRFSQWEYFIHERLPQLENFSFKITVQMPHYQHIASIESIIAAFRTPFWLKYKHWYVHFQYVINNEGPRLVLNSSRNGHVDFFQYYEHGFIRYFTSTTNDDDKSKMHTMWNVIFNLPDVQQAINFRHFRIPKYYLFDNVIRLGLDIDEFDDWQRSGSFGLLSQLVNLAQLKEIWFLLSNRQSFQANTINSILKKAPGVRIFGIANNGSLRDNPEYECAVLSRQIDHLIIRSPDITGMKLILERVEHLSTITFMCGWSLSTTWKKILKWLHEKEKKYSITADYRSLQVFLKQNIDILSGVENLYRID
ncbi:unnamed protein product [Rotaria magnacalcarata]|uniref:F-box domain-containing protein n=1 Tax=Rotaria magnacalcarata TaxID=392030 RepID=A0A816ESN2_9BILA|nr:unnamed protein product [Rotaria magnacalcarata]CAF3993522.1 unnamed protein product [Rotaria magnacalcarata]